MDMCRELPATSQTVEVIDAIEISDDDEDVKSTADLLGRNLAKSQSSLPVMIDLTSDSESSSGSSQERISTSSSNTSFSDAASPIKEQQEIDLSFTEVYVELLSENGVIVQAGDAVELQGDSKYGDILRVDCITKDLVSDNYKLRGSVYRRLRYFDGKFPRKENEVAKISDKAEEVPIDQMVNKVNLRLTNMLFPEARDLQNNVLVCRWKYREDLEGQCKEIVIQHLTEDEADTNYKISDGKSWQDWRKCNREDNTGKQVAFTLGDTFSGAGGVACGALMAGVEVRWCVEHCDKACDTFQINSPATQIYAMSIDGFVEVAQHHHYVDILHISPVCKTFSAAHTRPGCNDEHNEATLFSVSNLAEKARPRIITLEQTSGLPQRHKEHYNSLLQQLTGLGFSLRAATLNFAHFGVTQERKRLIIIASCPGSKLPDFPKRTHGPGLRPPVTINEALRNVSRRTPNHDPLAERAISKPPYDGDVPLKRTITCAGSDAYHPSGTRLFTIRELACIQGFPLTFLFANYGKTELRKQIGNAVPPIVYKAILESVKKTLAEEDALFEERKANHMVPTKNHKDEGNPVVIVLD